MGVEIGKDNCAQEYKDNAGDGKIAIELEWFFFFGWMRLHNQNL
jgi:hypothetical protein